MYLQDSIPLSDINLLMQLFLVAWISLVVLIVRRTIASGSVGLPAALVLTMSFLYGGCFVYAMPGYTHLRPGGHWYLVQYDFSEWMIVQATFASLLGLLGFAIGSGAFVRNPAKNWPPPVTQTRLYERNILTTLGMIGLIAFVFHYFRISFPMSSALIEAGRNVAVAALILGAYLARRDGKSLLGWVALAALVPLYYVVVFGFASYGFLFGLTLVAFWMAQLRRRRAGNGLQGALWSLLVLWLVLTAFIGWFSFRDEIRLVVWQGVEGSVFGIVLETLRETELFSPWNFDSLDLVNIRLNLNIFIGRMIEQHDLFPELQRYGATLVILPLVILPRFVWPGKPARGGSDFMEDHTGMILSDSATFGTGLVFEFFINFGYVGVLLGFITLGWIIRRIDQAAARRLARGDFLDFARFFVVGVVALDPLQRPFFIVNGAVFAWILMSLLMLALNRWSARLRRSAPNSMMQESQR
ncbi:hypothetical protein [Roseivivax jejudonensis]|uniref:hypothetical protein n=1 Tax=Roseivivax jejudonensis TaxID=1529041 RepID=UPI000A26C2DF|nr:hypothetical protein [Roseivivax jejudonensis]